MAASLPQRAVPAVAVFAFLGRQRRRLRKLRWSFLLDVVTDNKTVAIKPRQHQTAGNQSGLTADGGFMAPTESQGHGRKLEEDGDIISSSFPHWLVFRLI